MGLLNKRVIILLGCLCFTYLLFFKPTPITPVNDINLPFKRIKTQNCKPLPNYPDIQYAVIIDAGSTGSRIHVYRFNYCNQSPKLEDEVFVITKPGLSSYVHDPQAAADSLDKLLKAAVENVPKELYGCTPIALKATAGLRMLKDGMGDEILKAVEKKLRREYPFPVFKNDGVAIMGGDDEGVFAWITLNYLLGNIGQTDRKETAGVLDLGGGSTQIVFEPKNYELPTGGHRVDLEFSNHKYTLYQHSYDGYGLMQGRLKIKKAAKTTFKVPCLPDGQITHFEDDGVITKMTGTATDYGQCHNFITQNLFSQTQCSLNPCSFDGIYMPDIKQTFRNQDLYAFSYFYDKYALPFQKSNSFVLKELRESADAVCSSSIQLSQLSTEAVREYEKNKDWCIDLGFMYELLSTGYSLPDHHEIKTTKKVDGIEIGWCLGAAIQILDQQLSDPAFKHCKPH